MGRTTSGRTADILPEVTPVRRDQRYIFSGDRTAPAPPGPTAAVNKRGVRKRLSMFNIVVGLFIAGVLIVLYISNLLAVNTLAREIGQLQSYQEKVLHANAALQAEVDRKASLERIEAMARESLGLEIARETPVWFPMDENALDRAREAERLRERSSGTPRP